MKKMAKRFTALCCAAALVTACGLPAGAVSDRFSDRINGTQWNATIERTTRYVFASTDVGRRFDYGDTKKVTVSCNYYEYGVASIKTWTGSDYATNDYVRAAVSKTFQSNMVERTTYASSYHYVSVVGSGTGQHSLQV